MRDIDLLKLESQAAFQDLLDSIDGVSEQQAWGKVEFLPGEYMHSEGSILSTVMHIAAPKFLYGSAGYRNLEIRWRDTVDRLERFWPSWEGAKEYLHEAHEYWQSTWANERDLERMVTTFSGKQWPNWRVIWTVTQHDSYHAGQIHLLKAIVPPSTNPPPDESDLWRKYCEPLPSW
ncbi:MAG: DinB family protein [Fimbriimonas sp.]